MAKPSVGSRSRAPRARAGRTEKISISLDAADVRVLRRRADRLHGGNLSAAVSEIAQRIREEEGREALVAWLGPAADVRPEERDAITAEWVVEPPKRRRARAA